MVPAPGTEDPLVLVVGLGGVGSHCAHALVRAGINRLRLVDFDRVSLSSLNRHAVATRRDVGTPKVVACAEHFRAIRPECQVDARDEMFIAAASDELLGAAHSGESQSSSAQPQVVIDCIDDVSTKADLLTACVSRGLPVLSALGSGAKSDATSLCVARGLQDIENDPLATKLRKVFSARSVDLTQVTFVYSTQKPQRKLLPLTEEQRASPEEFGNVANFRLRVIPVMGTQPAIEGITLAMQTLVELGLCSRYCPRRIAQPRRNIVERYLDELKKREASRSGGRSCQIDVTVAEATFLVQEVWHNRSALANPGVVATAGQHLTFARWDPELALDVGNIFVVTEQEAAAHAGPAGVASEARERIEKALRRARTFLGPAPADEESERQSRRSAASEPPRPARAPLQGARGRLPPVVGRARTAQEAAEEEALVAEQLSRSAAFFGPKGQASVRGAFVVVVGLGGVGSAAASLLARAGVGRLRLVDGAACSKDSCHAIAFAADAGLPKVDACRARFHEIFPSCEVEAVAEHFEAANAAAVLAPDAHGHQPDLLLDCSTSLEPKGALLRAAAGAGVRVVTVVAPFGAADPTRIAVAPLKDVYASPSAVALRLALSSPVGEQADVVHTTEAGHWTRDAEPSISGLARLCLGMAAAAVALCRLSGEAVPEAQPPGMIGHWKKLRRALQTKQQQQPQQPLDDSVPDALALGCLAEHVWRGRSAVSGSLGDGASGLCLARWDHSHPVGLGNLVLLTQEEAADHEVAAARTGSLPQPLLDALAGSNAGELNAELLRGQVRAHRTLEKLHRHFREASAGSAPAVPTWPVSPPVDLASNALRGGPPSYTVGVAACCALAAAGLRLGFGGQPRRSRLAVVGAAVATALTAGATLLPTLRAMACDAQRGSSQKHPQHTGRGGRADGSPRAGFAGLVGDTPLIELKSLSEATGCRILAKAEFLNPGGCQKDRAALFIIAAAESEGLLRPGGTIVEGTSGSTGISLSLAAAERGYRVHIVMPDDQAAEKATLLRRFGAEVELVRPASITSPEHYVNVARRRAAELSAQPGSKGAVFSDQFENLANFRAHYEGTGPEIWAQCDRQLDAFVMSAGTGGTIAGVGRFLKEVAPSVRVCLADVPGSSLYNKVAHGVMYASEQAEQTIRRHRTDTIAEGIGIDRLTANFARGLPAHNGGRPAIDDAVNVSDQEALDMAHHLLAHEGVFVGSSAAVNCAGAVKAARRLGPGHTVVTVLCDNGLRHLTKFYNPDAWADFGLVPPREHAKHDLSFVS